MRSEFQAAIAQLIAEKGLPREVVMETVANALLSAYRKSYGGGENIRIEVDKNGDVHVWAARRVVAQVTNPNEEISLAEAQRLMPHAALGQTIDVDSSHIFAKIPAQTAKQVILQRIREAEHEYLYEQLKDWVGEIRLGTLTRERPKPLVDIAGRTTAGRPASVPRVADEGMVLQMIALARELPVATPVLRYAARLVQNSHPGAPGSPPSVRRFVRYGSSPRGVQALVLASKIRALLEGRLNVAFADVRATAHPALRHRVILNFEADAEGVTADQVVDAILAATPEAD